MNASASSAAFLPLATDSTTVDGAQHHVAGVENSLGFLDRQFGPAADGGNHQVEFAEDRRFLLVDDKVLRSRRLCRAAASCASRRKASDAPAVMNDGQRPGATRDLDAVFQQHVALVLRQRHVLLPAPIDQFDRSRAEPLGRRRAIRRHRAAAKDGHLFAFELSFFWFSRNSCHDSASSSPGMFSSNRFSPGRRTR